MLTILECQKRKWQQANAVSTIYAIIPEIASSFPTTLTFVKIERSPNRNPIFLQFPKLPLYKEKQEIFPKLRKNIDTPHTFPKILWLRVYTLLVSNCKTKGRAKRQSRALHRAIPGTIGCSGQNAAEGCFGGNRSDCSQRLILLSKQLK